MARLFLWMLVVLPIMAEERIRVVDNSPTVIQHPDELEVEVRHARGVRSLRLRRNPNVDYNVPIFYGDDETEEEPEALDDLAAYEDREKRSYFTVRSVLTEDGVTYKRSLSGNLNLDGAEYHVEPENESENEPGVAVRSAEEGHSHTMVKKEAGSRFHDEGGLATRNIKVEKRYNPLSYHKFGVKLLLVLDYSTYEYWKKKESRPLTVIRKYYSHVVHGMDLMYGGISASDFSIYVRLAGIFISKRSSDSAFTHDRRVNGEDGKRMGVNALDALNDIRIWDKKMKTTKFDNIDYDHAMVFTGLDIFSENKFRQRSFSTAGLAFTKAMCGTSSQSIVEDQGYFNSVGTAAHELGHSLGAGDHDGEGSAYDNACSPDYQYIMTAVSGRVKEAYAENPFDFSSCSVSQFRQYLIKDGNSKCLLVHASHEDQKAFEEHVEHPPGQMYGPTEQCKLIYGDQSLYCAGQERDAGICQSLWCWSGSGSNCNSRGGAITGTTCGDNKWCYRGKCRYDAKAPSADASCIHGDYGPPLSGTKHCSDLVRENPALCSNEHNRQLCCGSCKNVR